MNAENSIEVKDIKKSFKVYLDKSNLLKDGVIFWNRNRYERRLYFPKKSFFSCKQRLPVLKALLYDYSKPLQQFFLLMHLAMSVNNLCLNRQPCPQAMKELLNNTVFFQNQEKIRVLVY